MRQLSAPEQASARPGFTLAELLVALLLVNCALVALVSTSAATARWLASAGARTRAASAAVARVERLASQSCAVASSGSVDARGLREWWSVDREDDGSRSLSDTVEYLSLRGARRTAGASARTLC